MKSENQILLDVLKEFAPNNRFAEINGKKLDSFHDLILKAEIIFQFVDEIEHVSGERVSLTEALIWVYNSLSDCSVDCCIFQDNKYILNYYNEDEKWYESEEFDGKIKTNNHVIGMLVELKQSRKV